MKQIALFRFKERSSVASKDFISLPFERIRDEGFDFRDIPASTGIYGIHPYPAMFHFLVVRRLISEFSKENENILDPFMGSGVVAGECLVNGRNFVGYDINPLALLISKVRTTPISSGALLEALEYVSLDFKHRDPEDVDFPNIHYWFDSKIIEDLSRLRGAIFSIKEEEIRNFYKVVFSETVRRVSRTRYNEFKLLRKKDIVHSPQVLKTFREISLKNIGLLVDFYKKLPPTKATLVL